MTRTEQAKVDVSEAVFIDTAFAAARGAAAYVIGVAAIWILVGLVVAWAGIPILYRDYPGTFWSILAFFGVLLLAKIARSTEWPARRVLAFAEQRGIDTLFARWCERAKWDSDLRASYESWQLMPASWKRALDEEPKMMWFYADGLRKRDPELLAKILKSFSDPRYY
jgi:hypothetical protein